MTSSFDPRDFLEIAKQLGIPGASEASLRTAISRSYYAVFWIARNRLGIPDKQHVHTKLIGELKKIAGTTKAHDKMESLHKLRLMADYHLVPDDPLDGDWERNWSKAESLAKHLLSKF